MGHPYPSIGAGFGCTRSAPCGNLGPRLARKGSNQCAPSPQIYAFLPILQDSLPLEIYREGWRRVEVEFFSPSMNFGTKNTGRPVEKKIRNCVHVHTFFFFSIYRIAKKKKEIYIF